MRTIASSARAAPGHGEVLTAASRGRDKCIWVLRTAAKLRVEVLVTQARSIASMPSFTSLQECSNRA